MTLKAKTRWNNIKTAYNNYRSQIKRKCKSGAAAINIKEYKYARELKFLDGPGLENKSTFTTIEPIDPSEKKSDNSDKILAVPQKRNLDTGNDGPRKF